MNAERRKEDYAYRLEAIRTKMIRCDLIWTETIDGNSYTEPANDDIKHIFSEIDRLTEDKKEPPVFNWEEIPDCANYYCEINGYRLTIRYMRYDGDDFNTFICELWELANGKDNFIKDSDQINIVPSDIKSAKKLCEMMYYDMIIGSK